MQAETGSYSFSKVLSKNVAEVQSTSCIGEA